MPKMVAVTVPIAMPIGRAPCENVIPRTAAGDAVAVCNRTGTISATVPDCSKIADAIVLQSRQPVAAPTIERPGRKLTLTDSSASARTDRTEGALTPQSRGSRHRTHAHRLETLRSRNHGTAAIPDTGSGTDRRSRGASACGRDLRSIVVSVVFSSFG